MRNVEIFAKIQTIDSLFTKTQSACGHDLELMSHWAKYICILCAGALETSLPILFSDLIRPGSSQLIAEYVRRSLERDAKNPKTDRFVRTASSFKKDWGKSLLSYVESDGRKEAIDSIMANRHLIAHGRRSDITVVQTKEYMKKSVEVLEFIETTLP